MALEWTNERCLQLIEEIRKKRVIWEPRDAKKKNRRSKNDAIAAVAAVFSTTSSEIIRKWRNLTQSYRVYKRRTKKTTTGMGAKEVYRPNWFAFNALNDFMNDVYTPQATTDTMADEGSVEMTEDEDSEYHDAEFREYCVDDPLPAGSDDTHEENSDITNTDEGNRDANASSSTDEAVIHGKSPAKKQFKSPKKVIPSLRKTLKREHPEEHSEDPRVAEAYDYLISKKQKEDSASSKTMKDECDLFGEFIASQLRKEDSETRDLMMHEIHGMIFNLKCNKTYSHLSLTPLHMRYPTQHSSSMPTFLGMHSPTTDVYNYPPATATTPSPNFPASVSPMSSNSNSNPPTPPSSTYPYFPMSSPSITSERAMSPDA